MSAGQWCPSSHLKEMLSTAPSVHWRDHMQVISSRSHTARVASAPPEASSL